MGKKEQHGPAPAGIGDARFAKMYTDPRFQRFPKKKNKVEIDSRFAGNLAHQTSLYKLSPCYCCCSCCCRFRHDLHPAPYPM
jgi:hypothetical protein